MTALDARLRDAHALRDGAALIEIYCACADAAADEDHRGFFLTHALVFALEAGDARASTLRAALVAMGREEAQPDEA